MPGAAAGQGSPPVTCTGAPAADGQGGTQGKDSSSSSTLREQCRVDMVAGWALGLWGCVSVELIGCGITSSQFQHSRVTFIVGA
jgi:hypothetical protein